MDKSSAQELNLEAQLGYKYKWDQQHTHQQVHAVDPIDKGLLKAA